jgi:transposase
VSDPEDARRFARLAHIGPELLSPIQRRSAKTQNGLALVRAREVAVETRTKIVNAGRGIVKSSGHRLPTSATSSFARKAKEACPGVLMATLLPLLRVVENLTREVELYDKLVAQAGRPFRKFPPVRVRAIFASSLLNTSYHVSPISG